MSERSRRSERKAQHQEVVEHVVSPAGGVGLVAMLDTKTQVHFEFRVDQPVDASARDRAKVVDIDVLAAGIKLAVGVQAGLVVHLVVEAEGDNAHFWQERVLTIYFTSRAQPNAAENRQFLVLVHPVADPGRGGDAGIPSRLSIDLVSRARP